MLENITSTETKGQTFLVVPPPSYTRKMKAPEDCYLSVIDELADGLYGGSKLVKNSPQTNKDIYFVVRTSTTQVRSNRRNKTHRNVALFRTKKGGSTRSNIAFMTCSFVELDGANDSKIKTQGDVLTLIRENNLPEPSYVIETSRGHFHILWTYDNPLPWTEKMESYWASQQKRLIQLFEQGGFLVDKGASLNPCQNLRNPSQLHAYNYKRRCEVFIHKTFKKTSLRAIYKALNATNIPNPTPMKASVRLRQYERQNKTFTLTHKELAIDLNLSPRTIKREIKQAIQNGDLRIVARLGNNSEKTRTTQYESLIFIEKIPEVPLSISNNNSLKQEALLKDFQAVGAENGRRNRTLFAIGQYLKAKLGKQASIGAIRDALEGGAMRCHVSVREFERVLKSIMKPVYTNPFSLSKLRAWDLIVGPKHFH